MSNVPTDAELEKQAQERGAQRVTESKLKEQIKDVAFHVFPNTQLTVCVITLLNGFTVTGESACADPKMFNAEVGEKFAFAAAENKIWPLLGYALKQELFLSGSTFKDRLVKERTDLHDKIGKLDAFINGNEQFGKLDLNEQEDLREQLSAMRAYHALLMRRISRQG